MRSLPAQLLAALRALLVLTVVLGLGYPLVVAGVGQLALRDNAQGSLVEVDGRVVGSDESLLTSVCTRSREVAQANGVDGAREHCGPDGTGTPDERGTVESDDSPVPPDAVTGSGSGLDPHISPAYARLQVARVATARGLDVERVRELVEQHVQGRTLGFLGEPRVNVLRLNLALDATQ